MTTKDPITFSAFRDAFEAAPEEILTPESPRWEQFTDMLDTLGSEEQKPPGGRHEGANSEELPGAL
jgi:hypothetical protein